jgi:hypothetical protein
MPLSRHTVANEYALGGRDLYARADQRDPEAVLDGVAMAGLVGVLRQLGDLAEYVLHASCSPLTSDFPFRFFLSSGTFRNCARDVIIIASVVFVDRLMLYPRTISDVFRLCS